MPRAATSRHGIHWRFPTRYRDRAGNRVVVDFTWSGAARRQTPNRGSPERMAGGVPPEHTNDDLPVPADQHPHPALPHHAPPRVSKDHDETVLERDRHRWGIPDPNRVRRRAPSRAQCHSMRCMPGVHRRAQGVQGQDTPRACPRRASIGTDPTAGAARRPDHRLGKLRHRRRAVGRSSRLWWLLQDNRGVLVALAALLGHARTRSGAGGRSGATKARHRHRPLRTAKRIIRQPRAALHPEDGRRQPLRHLDLLSLAVAGLPAHRTRDKGPARRQVGCSAPATARAAFSASQRALLAGPVQGRPCV